MLPHHSAGSKLTQEEHFDIYDEQMNHLGIAPRREVHAKGYWHQSFHCWIVAGVGAERRILFQKRNALKDTFPNHFDITAAGHLSAGESVEQAARELEEELGVSVPFERLISFGTDRDEASGIARGVPFIDREIHHLFGLRLDQPLASYRLQVSEVAGLFEASLEAMLQLFQGSRDTLPASGILLTDPVDHTAWTPDDVLLRTSDFVPHGAAYYIRICEQLKLLP